MTTDLVTQYKLAIAKALALPKPYRTGAEHRARLIWRRMTTAQQLETAAWWEGHDF